MNFQFGFTRTSKRKAGNHEFKIGGSFTREGGSKELVELEYAKRSDSIARR